MRPKNSQSFSESLLVTALLLGTIALLLAPPVLAIASVAWLFVTATTPAVFSFRVALLIGILLGVFLVGAALLAASKVSGDAFPDAVRGIVLPSGAIVLASFILQPVAARMARNRIAPAHSLNVRVLADKS